MLILFFWLGLLLAFFTGWAVGSVLIDARYNRARYDRALLDGGKLRRRPVVLAGTLAETYHRETSGTIPPGLREWN